MATDRRGRRRPKVTSTKPRKASSSTRFADMLDAGVSGFVPQDASANDLLETIRSVVRGAKVFPPVIPAERGRQKSRRLRQSGGESEVAFVTLPRHQRDVVAMIAAGLNRERIARKLQIDLAAVDRLVFRILQSLSRSDMSRTAETKGSARRKS